MNLKFWMGFETMERLDGKSGIEKFFSGEMVEDMVI